MVLADCCMPLRRVGGTKVAVDSGGRHGWNVCLVLILSVFCVLFNKEVIAVVTENRLRSIINDKIL